MKQMLFILAIVLCMGVVYSETQTLGTVKQYDCISLKQSYWNSTYTNITNIQYPNKTSINTNYNMSRDNFGNYNYRYCDTSILGEYMITTTTDVDGVPTNVVYDFWVTPTGDDRGISLFLILIICAFFLFAIDYFVETGYMTFLGGILFLIAGTYSMIYGIGTLSEFWTRAIALVTLGVGIIFIIGSAYDLVWGEDDNDNNSGGIEED